MKSPSTAFAKAIYIYPEKISDDKLRYVINESFIGDFYIIFHFYRGEGGGGRLKERIFLA